MDVAFISKNCTPPLGRSTRSGGRLFYMDEKAPGKLLARIVLFRENNEIVCICCMDQKKIFHKTADKIRGIISDKCSISFNNIILVASHTHSVPDLVPVSDSKQNKGAADFSFVEEYSTWLVEAILEAKQKFCSLQYWKVGETVTEKWSQCRRPLFRGENEKIQAATQASRDSDDFLGLDGIDDNNLTVFAAYSKDQQIGGFVNYACHPVTMYGSKFYSADFPGAFYEYIDKQNSGIFLYANGPNANVGPVAGGFEFCQKMGKDLAVKTLAALESGKKSLAGKLRISSEILNIPRRKPSFEQVKYAREFLDKEPDDDEIIDFPRKMYGVDYHMGRKASLQMNQNLCNQLLSLHKEIESGVDSEELRIHVIALSDEIVFIGVSAEMFNQFKLAILEQSPYKYNCIMQLANGWNGYIPPSESYELGGYECCLSQINRLIPEAFDLIVKRTIKALNTLKIKDK